MSLDISWWTTIKTLFAFLILCGFAFAQGGQATGVRSGPTLPSACQNQVFIKNSDVLYWCNQVANTWHKVITDYSDLSGAPTLPANTTATASNFFTAYNASTGAFAKAQPAYTDLTGTPTLAQSLTNASHKWFNSYDASTGLFTQTQPDYSDLSGTPTLPVNTTATSSNFFTAYNSTTGAFTKAQPAFTDISGTAGLAQGGTNADLSASGSSTAVLAQNASHVIAARALIAADIPSLAASILTSGQVSLARGGTNADLSATGGTSQFLKQASSGAAITVVRPACSDLSNAAASCSTDTTSATNITSGTLPAAQLPNPSATTLGGVESIASTSHNFLTSISTSGVPAKAQPACADLSDSSGGCSMSTTAGGDLSGTLPSPTVAKVNGISYSATAAAHSVEVITTANATATAKTVPDCTDSTGNHLNYTQSTDAFSCGTSASVTGTVTSIATTSPITGGTITGTGTIACAGCVTSSSPGVGIAHFAGSTQAVTSSAVVDADLSSTIGVAHGGTALATLTAHALYAGNGTSAPTAVGPDSSSTKALMSAGSSADPAFRAIAAGDLPANTKIHGFGATFSTVANAQVAYGVIPYSCTISAWNIMTDATAATFKVWKIATGSAIPTVTNGINTNGVSLSSGTAVHSTTVSDFSPTSVTANDMFAIVLSGVTGSPTFLNAFVECDQ